MNAFDDWENNKLINWAKYMKIGLKNIGIFANKNMIFLFEINFCIILDQIDTKYIYSSIFELIY